MSHESAQAVRQCPCSKYTTGHTLSYADSNIKGSCLVFLQRIPEELTLDALLEMNESKVKETMKRCGARDEECSRLNGALSCLRKVTESGTDCLVLLGDCCPSPFCCSDTVWGCPGTTVSNGSGVCTEGTDQTSLVPSVGFGLDIRSEK